MKKRDLYALQQGKRVEKRITKILDFIACSVPIAIAIIFIINI